MSSDNCFILNFSYGYGDMFQAAIPLQHAFTLRSFPVHTQTFKINHSKCTLQNVVENIS